MQQHNHQQLTCLASWWFKTVKDTPKEVKKVMNYLIIDTDRRSSLIHNLNATHLCKVKAMLQSKYCYFQKTRLLFGLYGCRLKHIVMLT